MAEVKRCQRCFHSLKLGGVDKGLGAQGFYSVFFVVFFRINECNAVGDKSNAEQELLSNMSPFFFCFDLRILNQTVYE